ncbi:hypothetical protein ACFFX0_21810 [Citricoccus parietis]|uniref:Uncharacterized protein n=1 Tax=Citricoccus parietis TaxID=592307 RepID=A0ABV5G5G3_9MICC
MCGARRSWSANLGASPAAHSPDSFPWKTARTGTDGFRPMEARDRSSGDVPPW